MKKLRAILFSTAIAIVLIFPGCSGAPSQKPVLSSDCSMSSFFIEAKTNGLKKNLGFALDHSTATYSAINLDWIDKGEPDILIATFNYEGIKVLVGETEQESGVTPNSFAGDVVYTVVAEDGTTKDYTISLSCPQINNELPVLSFQMDGPIGDDYVKGTLDMYGHNYTEGLWGAADGKVEVRLRGNSTRGLPKKPYRIKFPEKHSPLGLNHAKEKSWTLLANDCDKTLLRNKIAFEWSRILFSKNDAFHGQNALLFTPASLQVNLFVNKEYAGIYQMSDQIERADGRIELKSLKAADEGNANKITGGYLLETDVHASVSSEPFHFTSSRGIKITPKYPKDDDHADEQYTYIQNHLNSAEEALFGAGFTDASNGWRKYWDEATAIDFMIVKEMAWDPDGYTSIYLYKRRGDDKFYFGPVWDFDKAFNNDKRKLDLYSDLMIYKSFPTSWGQIHWHARMWDDAEFKEAVKNRWNSRKADLLAAALKVIYDEPLKMEKSIKANFTKWKVSEQKLGDAAPAPATYEKGLEWLEKYVKNRYEFLDRTFNAN